MLQLCMLKKRPVIYDVADQLLCDNETTLDMYSVFDTSTLQGLILGNTTDPTTLPFQDPSTFTIEYSYVDEKWGHDFKRYTSKFNELI